MKYLITTVMVLALHITAYGMQQDTSPVEATTAAVGQLTLEDQAEQAEASPSADQAKQKQEHSSTTIIKALLENKSDVTSLLRALVLLKTYTIITLLVAMQIDYDLEDWYGRCRLFESKGGVSFITRLLVILHFLDGLLYDITYFDLSSIVAKRLYAKCLYELCATLTPIAGIGSFWQADEQSFFNQLIPHYYAVIPVNAYMFNLTDAYFDSFNFTMSDIGKLCIMAHKLIVHVLTTMPFLKNYKLVPKRHFVHVSQHRCAPTKEHEKTIWYKIYRREVYVARTIQKFMHLDGKTFDAVFTWLRQQAGRYTIEELINLVLKHLLAIEYKCPPGSRFPQPTLSLLSA